MRATGCSLTHSLTTTTTASLRSQRLHGVQPGVGWGTLPGGQRDAWNTMQCDTLLHASASAQAAVDARAVSEGLAQAGGVEPTGAVVPASNDALTAECGRVGRRHHVVVGSSWGSLPTALRQWWTSAGCDRLSLSAGGLASTVRATPSAWLLASEKPAHAAPSTEESDSPSGECQSMQLAHTVRIGSSWGTLPAHLQQRWTQLNCDRLVN